MKYTFNLFLHRFCVCLWEIDPNSKQSTINHFCYSSVSLFCFIFICNDINSLLLTLNSMT